VSEIVADQVGVAAMLLGAGRVTKESGIDLAVGVLLRKKVGDAVREGEALAIIHANHENVEEVMRLIRESIKISDHARPPELILGEVF
jgi:pyrimidine-nucleoside phosphorylase